MCSVYVLLVSHIGPSPVQRELKEKGGQDRLCGVIMVHFLLKQTKFLFYARIENARST
jgi:hypothetical protein